MDAQKYVLSRELWYKRHEIRSPERTLECKAFSMQIKAVMHQQVEGRVEPRTMRTTLNRTLTTKIAKTADRLFSHEH